MAEVAVTKEEEEGGPPTVEGDAVIVAFEADAAEVGSVVHSEAVVEVEVVVVEEARN